MIRAIETVATVLLVVYPVAVYATLTRWGPRWSSLLLLGLLLPVVAIRLRSIVRGRAGLRSLVGGKLQTLGLLPLVTAGLLLLAALANTAEFLYATPVVTNVLLLLAFGSTLHFDPPMIERFARLVEPNLSEAERRWCRGWTVIWSIFFAVNAAIAALLAAFGLLAAWTLYNGLIAYGLMGLLGASEWILRKRRFGWSSDRWPDRLLRRFFGGEQGR